MFERQLNPQALNGYTAIQVLAAAFAGFGSNARWPVFYDHGRLDLVTVLPTGTRTSRSAELTFGKQFDCR